MKRADIDILNAYFTGSLDDENRAIFEERLRKDPEFEKVFQEYTDLHLGIDYSVLKSAKKNLQVLEATLPEVELKNHIIEPKVSSRSKSGLSNLWKIAAAIIVLAFSTLVIWYYQQPPDPETIFNEYFEPYPNEFVSPKRGEGFDSDLKIQAFQAYDNKNYDAAITNFNTILKKEEDAMALFYLANSQLANDQSQLAIATFQIFLEMSEDFTDEAKWYLALSYLKQQQLETARRLLREIKSEGKFGPQADEVLRRLK